jgi:1-acyl-sn-glycerol-3-phosphate acyltransferase
VKRAPFLWLRVAAGGLGVIVVALAIDLWLRCFVLLAYRKNSPKRLAAFNGATRLWGDALFAAARWAVSLDVTIEGHVPETGRFLIVANHQSSLDIPFLITTFRALDLKFVAMEQLRHGKPVISLVLRHGGSVCVGKKNVGEDLAALTRFATELAGIDGSPVIFPAGGLERDQGARRFYLAGIEVLRRGSRLPILPVAIDGMSKAPTTGGLLRLAGAHVTMRIGEPVSFEQAARDPRATYEALEQWIYGTGK